MLRITRYMKALADPSSAPVHGTPPGPVVIWNLTRRCNLACRHCYAFAADAQFTGEPETPVMLRLLEDLKAASVPALILSGGEPLVHPDVHAIAARAKSMGFHVALSSNGTLLDAQAVDRCREVGYDYVGVSIDGLRATHDHFRRRDGAFDEALDGLRRARDAGLPVGLRFTLTHETAADLPAVLGLMDSEGVDRFYLSHLNYAGRGQRRDRPELDSARRALETLFMRCWADIQAGRPRTYVTGNNDADAAYLLLWAHRVLGEAAVDTLLPMLRSWGGNASGLHVANIDHRGGVHPDTMWDAYTLGNAYERPFGAIWADTSDPLMAGLKQQPRPVTGRCAGCGFLAVCGGNTRSRAWQQTGDPWAEDPGCYLTDAEIGLDQAVVA